MEVKKANVVFLVSSLRGGGSAHDFFMLSPVLLKHAKNRYLFSLSGLDKRQGGDKEKIFFLDWRSWLDYPYAVIRLARFILRNRINLVYSTSRCVNLVSYAACRLSGRPVRMVMEEITQPRLRYSLESSFSGWIWQILMAKFYPKADLVFCNSESTREELIRWYGCSKERVKLVKNPIPVSDIERRVKGPSDGRTQAYRPYFITANRIVRGKGYEELLTAYALIREKSKCRLMIAGDGPLFGRIKKLAVRLGILEDVLFLGWVDDVVPFYKDATAFITASYCEGLSNSLLEAMAAGVPVVSTRSTSWIEDFEKKGACISVPVGDSAALSKAMIMIASDETLRRRLIDNGFKVVAGFREEESAAERDLLLKGVLEDFA